QCGLGVFDEFFDAEGVGFSVTVAGERVGAAGRFDENIGPDDARFDVNRSDLAEADADFVYAKPGTFAAADGFVADLDVGREQPVAARPTAGLEGFGRH